MNSRQRVRMALNHKEPDKIPIDFGAMRSTGISAIAYNKLKNHLNIKGGETRVYDIFQQLAEPEDEISEIMGADVVQLHRYMPAFGINIAEYKDGLLPDGSKCRYPKDFNPKINKKGEHEIYQDGILIAKMPKTGLFYDLVYHPYEGMTDIAEVDSVVLQPINETEIDFLSTNAKHLYHNTDKAILGCFGGNILEAGQGDWGYETFYINLILEKKLMHHYFDRLTRHYIADLEIYLKTVGEYIDVIQFGDDLGTQDDLQISIELYREMIKPYHKRIYQYVRKNHPDIKVFMHSCGSVYDAIPDLIDAGVQVLNPIQLSAAKMNPSVLKREFGKDLIFWGGGVDTQTTLTFRTVDEIKDSVKRNIEIFAPGGGYVFTQVHNILANIIPEKITAVYQTANELRDYPIKMKK